MHWGAALNRIISLCETKTLRHPQSSTFPLTHLVLIYKYISEIPLVLCFRKMFGTNPKHFKVDRRGPVEDNFLHPAIHLLLTQRCMFHGILICTSFDTTCVNHSEKEKGGIRKSKNNISHTYNSLT